MKFTAKRYNGKPDYKVIPGMEVYEVALVTHPLMGTIDRVYNNSFVSHFKSPPWPFLPQYPLELICECREAFDCPANLKKHKEIVHCDFNNQIESIDYVYNVDFVNNKFIMGKKEV